MYTIVTGEMWRDADTDGAETMSGAGIEAVMVATMRIRSAPGFGTSGDGATIRILTITILDPYVLTN